MEKICIIFGGNSPEHDISIITGMQCANYLQTKYEIEKIYIGLDNKFYYATPVTDLGYFADKQNIKLKPVMFFNGLSKKGIVWQKVCDIKCVVNCCHGGVGENGNLAGFFESLSIPFTSASTISSAIAMDKQLTKTLVKGIIKTAKGVEVNKENFEQSSIKIEKDFGSHFIVKPNALGSSIGVKVCTKDDYKAQIEAIFEMNDSALVEEKIEPMIELNQACYKKGEELILSAIEQPLSREEFLTFDEKFVHEGKTKVKDRLIPAPIDKKLSNKITSTTTEIYKHVRMNGVVRIDYMFNTETKELYFNEINTVPGSLAFYLFEPIGIDYITLLEDMIENCTHTKKYSYFDTKILTKKLL